MKCHTVSNVISVNLQLFIYLFFYSIGSEDDESAI